MDSVEIGKMLVSDYAFIGYEAIIMILLVVLSVKLSAKKKEKVKEQESTAKKQKEELLQKSLINEKRR